MARQLTEAEKRKLAKGPRYDPSKPKRPWGERDKKDDKPRRPSPRIVTEPGYPKAEEPPKLEGPDVSTIKEPGDRPEKVTRIVFKKRRRPYREERHMPKVSPIPTTEEEIPVPEKIRAEKKAAPKPSKKLRQYGEDKPYAAELLATPISPAAERAARAAAKRRAKAISKRIKAAKGRIPPELLPFMGAAGTVAVAEPTPFGEALLVVIVGAAIGITTWQSRKELAKVPVAARQAINNFRDKFGRNPTADEVVIVDKTGKVITANDAMRMAGVREGIAELVKTRPDIPMTPTQKWTPPRVKPIPPYRGTLLKPPRVREAEKFIWVTKAIESSDIDKLHGIFINYKEPVVILPGTKQPMPRRLIQDTSTLAERTGIMIAAAQQAATRVATLPYTRAQYEALSQALREAHQAKIDKAFRDINAGLTSLQAQGRIAPQVGAHYRRAYEAYLVKKAQMEVARKAFVASLNPQPVYGKITEDMEDAYTAYLLTQLGKQTSAVINNATSKATKAALNAYNKAIDKGATATEAATKTKEAAETAYQNAIQPITNTAVKTAAQAATQTAVNTATTTAITTATTTTTATTAITDIPVTDVPPPPPPPPPVLPKGASDKKKRKAIKKARGAIAWRHGELHGKDVWHVGMYPYTRQSDYLTVIGRKPAGATIMIGPGSARQTIKLLYGKSPPKSVRGDIGFFDFIITPKGARKVDIEFTPDPKMETTGDITIGRRTFPLTRGKSVRITPRRPKLRK